MTEVLVDCQQTESEATIQGIPKAVPRPWIIYLMSVWAFFGIGSFLTSVVKVMFRENQSLLQIASVSVMALSLLLVVCVFQMRQRFIMIFGILCIGLALWQSLNAVSVLLSENPSQPILVFQLFYIIPSLLFASLALRPNLLASAKGYRAYKEFESMKAASLKAMRR